MMSQPIETLAQRFGLSSEQVQAGAGAILQLLQDKNGGADFQRLLAAVPGAAGWLDQAKPLAQGGAATGGGLLGQAAGLIGALGGQQGGGLAAVLGQLGQAGFKPDTAAQFVPALLEQLKSAAGPELVGSLLKNVPGLGAASGGGGAAGDLLGKLLK